LERSKAIHPKPGKDERVSTAQATKLSHAREVIPHPLGRGLLISKHILVDPEKGVVTGILDFGNIGISDPAFDFDRLT